MGHTFKAQESKSAKYFKGHLGLWNYQIEGPFFKASFVFSNIVYTSGIEMSQLVQGLDILWALCQNLRAICLRACLISTHVSPEVDHNDIILYLSQVKKKKKIGYIPL